MPTTDEKLDKIIAQNDKILAALVQFASILTRIAVRLPPASIEEDDEEEKSRNT
jgi:hypothetical protein